MGRRRGCGEVCIGGGGRWGGEGGMCVGGIGTVPVAGSVGACTCGLDRQWGRRGRRGRCDGQRWRGVPGAEGLRRRGDGGWRRRRWRRRRSWWRLSLALRRGGSGGECALYGAHTARVFLGWARAREGESARASRLVARLATSAAARRLRGGVEGVQLVLAHPGHVGRVPGGPSPTCSADSRSGVGGGLGGAAPATCWRCEP